MPRYYFNLKDGREELDNVGVELAGIDAARIQAVIFSGEVLRDGGGKTLWQGEPWRLWVSDQPDGKGKTFFALNFSAIEGAA
jgi:hypothetical protein